MYLNYQFSWMCMSIIDFFFFFFFFFSFSFTRFVAIILPCNFPFYIWLSFLFTLSPIVMAPLSYPVSDFKLNLYLKMYVLVNRHIFKQLFHLSSWLWKQPWLLINTSSQCLDLNFLVMVLKYLDIHFLFFFFFFFFLNSNLLINSNPVLLIIQCDFLTSYWRYQLNLTICTLCPDI